MNNYWRSNNRGGRRRGRGFRGFGEFRGMRRPFGNPGHRHQFPYQNSYSYRNDLPRVEKKHVPPVQALSEKDIFVTEYINDHKGFHGIIKSRFSDFQVSEVNEKGEIAQLTDLSAPPPPAEDNVVVDDEDLLLNKYNLEILPMETWDRINKLALCSGPDFGTVEIDVTGMLKEERTKIHEAVKKAFGDSIVGSTVTVADKKYCKFEKYRKGVRVDNRVKWTWPAEYVHFVVYKENCDTMEAASRIMRRLRMNPNMKTSMLGYAGTKDRRAKTSQWFSLRKVDPRKIVNACKDLPSVKVGNFSFSPVHLKLGMLKGNRFRICLRNVSEDAELVEAACVSLRDHGFLNYYGLQRFGSSTSAPTSTIGLHLLQGSYQQAIACILEERAGPLQRALAAFHRHGPAAALRLLPSGPHDRHAPELRLLRALADGPQHLLHALDKIPRNTRLLYVHSYQSLVWNAAVSERVRRLALRPAPGDLVPCLADAETMEPIDETPSDGEDEVEDAEQEKADLDATQVEKKSQEKKQPKKMADVKILTQEDVDSGRYTIFDIVLPLPGHSVTYPPNMQDFYHKMLTRDGLTLDMKHKHKSYAMCGGYRHAAVRPLQAEWRRARYDEPAAELLLSDRDLLEGAAPPADRADGKYCALLLTMSLPTSCYATMALRELLKADTSCSSQAKLNDYHKLDAKQKQTELVADEKEEGEAEAEKRKMEDGGDGECSEDKKCKIDD